MAVGNTGFLTELDIRIWLRDNDPEANKLLDDYEFSSEEIRTAMTLAIDYWNEMPPHIINFDINTFPFRHAFLKGTVANLLFIAANRFRRNALQYQTAGGAVFDQEKYQQYDAAGQRLWDEFRLFVDKTKRALNAEYGWGRMI